MTTIELDDDNFECTIEDNDIVLVDFWATWCAPCRQFAPIFETSSQNHPEIVHGKLNTETAPRIAINAGISAIPTLIAFREGVIVFRQTGALSAAALDQVIDSVKGLDMRQVRDDLAAQNDATELEH